MVAEVEQQATLRRAEKSRILRAYQTPISDGPVDDGR